MLLWGISIIDFKVCYCWPQKKWATALGVCGFNFFALSLLLSTRCKILEKFFGGLDQIYQLHRKLGVWGGCLILLHPWAEAIKWIPHRMEKFFLFVLPIHGRLSVNLGSYSYWLMVFILGITLLKLLSYDKWKIVHKFMSVVFILACFHVILSEKRVGSEFTHALLYIPMGIGILSILYKQVYLLFFASHPALKVTDINYISDNVVEISLDAIGSPLHYSPGQYGFFSFKSDLFSNESHPFTLVESEDRLKTLIIVKKRGDFTSEIYKNIKLGCLAYFEGPYGRLDYRQGGPSQIWIAGGIGVVLFLSWIKAMSKNPDEKIEVDFYYCVHRSADVIYYAQFLEFSKKQNFRIFLFCTEENNRLDIDKIMNHSGGIRGKEVFMCGPLKLTEYFNKQLQISGVNKKDIHFENFEFF